MKSFKDYEPNSSKQQTNGPKPTDGQEWGKTDNESAEELVRRVASAYEGKSSMDMMRGILSEAEKSKRAGTLTNAEIDEFYAQFAPMLDEGQRKQLEGVVQRLKDI